MGGGDRCAVYGCDNDRRYPERYKYYSVTVFFNVMQENLLNLSFTRTCQFHSVTVTDSYTK